MQLNQMKGIDEVIKNLNKEIKGVEGRTRAGLKKAGMFVERKSMKKTPVVTGNLRSSHYSESFNTPRGPGVEIGFTASYAPSVHENPRAGKTGGKSHLADPGILPSGRKSTRITYSTVGGWKFLEIPLKRNVRRILEIIKQNAKLKK